MLQAGKTTVQAVTQLNHSCATTLRVHVASFPPLQVTYAALHTFGSRRQQSRTEDSIHRAGTSKAGGLQLCPCSTLLYTAAHRLSLSLNSSSGKHQHSRHAAAICSTNSAVQHKRVRTRVLFNCSPSVSVAEQLLREVVRVQRKQTRQVYFGARLPLRLGFEPGVAQTEHVAQHMAVAVR
jgi:hypothetical protein